MSKEPQVTADNPKSLTVRVYTPTKLRLQKLIRKKAEHEDRPVTEIELVDKYVNSGLRNEERKLKIA